MAEGERPKAKAKAKRGQYTDKAQSERFIEAARERDIVDVGESFERAFKTIVPPKPRKGL